MRHGLDRRGFLGLAGAAVLLGCTQRPGERPQARAPGASPSPSPSPFAPSDRPVYTQDVEDAFYDLKTRAGRFAQQLSTYDPGTVPQAVAALREPLRTRTATALAPLQHADVWSRAEVRLVQLGGLVPVSTAATYASCMVVLEQELTDQNRKVRTVTRTLDVRLRRPGREWVVEELVSAGGTAVPRPDDLSALAVRVLDSERIVLADSARWDIHSGIIDQSLLQVMSDLAGVSAYSVAVLRNGHPPNVIDGRARPPLSNHTKGRAVDIYEIDGVPVERLPPDQLRAFLQAVPALGGRREVGAPPGFDLDGPRRDFFANQVHVDHVHIAVEPPARPR